MDTIYVAEFAYYKITQKKSPELGGASSKVKVTSLSANFLVRNHPCLSITASAESLLCRTACEGGSYSNARRQGARAPDGSPRAAFIRIRFHDHHLHRCGIFAKGIGDTQREG